MADVDLAELTRLGLYDPEDEGAEQRRELLELLAANGVTVDEMVAADREHRLPFVLGDRQISPGPGVLTIDEVAARVALPVETVGRLWRALGLAETTGDRPQFSEADALAVHLLAVTVSTFGESGAIQLARTIGSAMARVAETGFTLALTQVEGGFLLHAESEVAAARASQATGSMAPMTAMIFDVVFRHHIEAVARRWDASPPDDPATIALAVGFADLVGFTSLSHQLSAEELAQVVTDFETIAAEAAASVNGRLVKLIGDEIMFVAPTPSDGCVVALELIDRAAVHPRLPTARASLAAGKVVPFEGDYYGPIVNLASRLTDAARGGELLVTTEVAAELPAHRFLTADAHELSLKGFAETVTAHAVMRARVRNEDAPT